MNAFVQLNLLINFIYLKLFFIIFKKLMFFCIIEFPSYLDQTNF